MVKFNIQSFPWYKVILKVQLPSENIVSILFNLPQSVFSWFMPIHLW